MFKSEKVGLQEPLGTVLGRSWGILEAVLGSPSALRYWKTYYGSKIHVFDVDKLSRRVLDRTWPNLAAKRAENDPKMAPQDDPKSTKNGCQKMIKILIAKKGRRVVFLGQPGGMRWPPGGIIGGAKNSLFEICKYLRHMMALRFRDFGVRSGTLGSAPTGRAAD